MNEVNTWKLYSDNEEVWQTMLIDCANAKKSIVLEQFIFVNDNFGQKLIDICKNRAKDGVDVRFLWDAAGSFTFWGSELVEELRKAGIKLIFWKTLIPGFFKVNKIRSWFFRNHRRTLVIDESIGYSGSLCVQENLKGWRDTNVRLEGPVVKEMRNAFDQMWARAQNKRPNRYKKPRKTNEFRYITNYPAPGRRHIYSEVLKALRKAKDSVYITVPYFVPTHRLLRTIKAAAYRGVDVKIILPERSDHYFVDLGARISFNTLLKSGVKIYLYTGNMIHNKAIVVDDTWATVGSMNLDSASLLYNFEANIVTTNDRFAKELKSHFFEDLNDTKEVIPKQWQKEFLGEKALYFVVYLIKRFL